MAPHVEAALTAPERLSLVDDAWALMRAGEQQASDYLTLVSGFGREPASGVLGTVAGRLGVRSRVPHRRRRRGRASRRSCARCSARSFDALGFSAGSQDSDDRRSLRAVVIARARQPRPGSGRRRSGARGARSRAARRPAARSDARRRHRPRGGLARRREAVRRAGGGRRPGDVARRALPVPVRADRLRASRRSSTAASTTRCRRSCAARTRRSSWRSFLGHPAARARTWAFTKANWEALAPKITIALGDVNFVGGLGAFCDAGARDDIQSFFAAHKLPAASRTLKQTVERINNCIGLRERQRATVAGWLSSR